MTSESHPRPDESGRKNLRFVIIGAGMSGILSAIKLQEAGFDDFVIYEKADSLGGTWRENQYPGLACDVPSHMYSYSFALNPEWSSRFSPGPEIRAYFEDVARRYGVESRIQYGMEITRAAFEAGRWRIEAADGTTDEADFVIAATGVLHHPAYPDIEGRDSFAGPMFHSARWNHDVSLAGKRVGIIGNGATAIQIVAALVDEVSELTVFQRTAQWIMPVDNPAYSDEERAEFRADPNSMEKIREEVGRAFCDGFANVLVDANSPVLDAIQKPNANLVTEGIERIEEAGVRTRDGHLHELDVLILATGFRVDRFMRPMEVIGRNGAALEDAWQGGAAAYMAVSLPDFPNLFMLNGPNGPVGNFSLIDVAELQFSYIMQLIEQVRSGECREISASSKAMRRFDADRREAAKTTIWNSGCKSWYLDDDGLPTAWPWTFDRFREEMARPCLADYEMK
jgi:cation diffusion facilitator CzcD-associated flavoprotein CzcO